MKGPLSGNVEAERYGHRTASSCKSHFDVLSAGVQKFAEALCHIRACNPTGVTEGNIVSMAVAIHLEDAGSMEYNKKDIDKWKWTLFRACKVLRTRTKWSQEIPCTTPNTSTD